MHVLVIHLSRADVGELQPAVRLMNSRGRVFSSAVNAVCVAVYCAEKHNRSLSACSLTGCFTGLAAYVVTSV